MISWSLYYTYILYNKEIDKYYVGYTSNLTARTIEHNKIHHKTKYTRRQIGEWKLVYNEEYKTRSEAMAREREVKSWKSAKRISQMIKQSR